MGQKKNKSFEVLFENLFNRYQHGQGFLEGDVVKLKDNYKNSDWYKAQADNVKQSIDYLKSTENNIRISSLKYEKPRSAGSFGAWDRGPINMADIVEEINPSNWTNPITIPTELLEMEDMGYNLPPVPDNQKRKGDIDIKPKDVDVNEEDTVAPDTNNKEPNDNTKVGNKRTKQTQRKEGGRNLENKNKDIGNTNKWDDKKPGAGNYKS